MPRTLALLVTIFFALPLLAKRPSPCCGREMPQAERQQRLLIVAPHIDDEAIAAGAYAADAAAGGAEVFIVYLTAGDHSRTAMALNRLTFFASASLTRKGQTRLGEAAEAASRLGIPPSHVFLLGYPDRGLAPMLRRPDRTLRSASTGKREVPYPQAISPGAPHRMANLVSDFEQVLDLVEPDIVIAPIAEDRHPDHRVAAGLVHDALAARDGSVVRMGYVIHSWSLLRFRRLPPKADPVAGEWVSYAISDDARERKRELLKAYRSQRRSPYLSYLFSRSTSRHEFFFVLAE